MIPLSIRWRVAREKGGSLVRFCQSLIPRSDTVARKPRQLRGCVYLPGFVRLSIETAILPDQNSALIIPSCRVVASLVPVAKDRMQFHE